MCLLKQLPIKNKITYDENDIFAKCEIIYNIKCKNTDTFEIPKKNLIKSVCLIIMMSMTLKKINSFIKQ
jgi:hypothetical protein